ncbi:MAG: L,D-transpeptidase family protein [Methylocystis sp.]|nr:L,D-transpeptidase family protein [Methylocystis sp.]
MLWRCIRTMTAAIAAATIPPAYGSVENYAALWLAPFAPPPPALMEFFAAHNDNRAPAAANRLYPSQSALAAVVALQNARYGRLPLSAAFAGDLVEARIPDVRRALALAVSVRANAASGGPHAALRRAQRAAIAVFYAARGFEPLWRDGAGWSSAATAVLQRLRQADEDGLDLRSYRLPAEGDGAPSAPDELDLSEAVAAYAAQASGARVDPQKVSHLIGARPPLPDTGRSLAAVAAGFAQAGDVLQDFNPHHRGYRALKAKLAQLRIARSPGEHFFGVRVADAGLALSDSATPRHAAWQSNGWATRIEAEIIANMERWRWLPRELGDSRVEVNIPNFELSMVRDGAIVLRARVIVGKQQTPTPIFSNHMRFIIVNPYWNVPPSILKNEMLARHDGDLSYLSQRGFDVSYRHGRLVVRQRPGERNALGRIKFMFPNDYSVYLHDTPTRGLFAQSRRAFSHGCVRLDQPFRLAEAVLGRDNGWPEERVRRLVGGSERFINLAQPLPIHIEYFTAYVDGNGDLQLRNDLYGYSAKVRAALGLDGQ